MKSAKNTADTTSNNSNTEGMPETTANKWPVGFTVYMGDKAETARRLAALDTIAHSFGYKKSELVRRIADGDLVVIPKSALLRALQDERESGKSGK